MNYCNFAKVIIARSTKDKNLLTWWENHEKNDADAVDQYQFVQIAGIQMMCDTICTIKLCTGFQKCMFPSLCLKNVDQEFKTM